MEESSGSTDGERERERDGGTKTQEETQVIHTRSQTGALEGLSSLVSRDDTLTSLGSAAGRKCHGGWATTTCCPSGSCWCRARAEYCYYK